MYLDLSLTDQSVSFLEKIKPDVKKKEKLWIYTVASFRRCSMVS
jgi:hypothetical protein